MTQNDIFINEMIVEIKQSVLSKLHNDGIDTENISIDVQSNIALALCASAVQVLLDGYNKKQWLTLAAKVWQDVINSKSQHELSQSN